MSTQLPTYVYIHFLPFLIDDILPELRQHNLAGRYLSLVSGRTNKWYVTIDENRYISISRCFFFFSLQFPFMHFSANEIDIRFQYRYANQYPKAIRLVSSGLINVKPLVTHRFSLENAVDAFYVAADPSKGAVKVQIQD